MTTLHQLLTNVAIVAITMAVWTFLRQYVSKTSPATASLLLGCMMTIGMAGAMLLPVVMPSGPLLDLRYTFLAIAGFFGGPLGVIIPAVVAIALRAWFGGVGVWVGIPLIVLASVLSLVGHRVLAGRIPGLRDILVLAASVMFSGTIGFFLVLPVSTWMDATLYRILPLGSLLFLSTTIAALALANEMRRQQAVDENHLHRAINNALPDCLNAKDLSGRFIVANPATARLMGAASVEGLIGKSGADFYDAETVARFQADDRALLSNGSPLTIGQRISREGKEDIWLSTLKAPLYGDDGEIAGVITHNREITQQKRLEMQLSIAQRHLADALSSMADGLVMYDENWHMLFCNEQYRRLFPLTADVRVPGAHINTVIETARLRGDDIITTIPLNASNAVDSVEQLIGKGDLEARLADGRFVAVRAERTQEGSCLISFSDITEAKRAEHELMRLNTQLEALANTDGLTGLLNRRAFDRLLEESCAAASKNGAPLTLMLLDIDNFKAFNDTYGHQQGDACLQKVSDCLLGVVKDMERVVVARYGGEEIGIILPEIGAAEAYQRAEHLRVAVKNLAIKHTGSERGVITLSIGVSSHSDGLPVAHEDILRIADEGLYAAKAAGRDRVCSPQKAGHTTRPAEFIRILS